MRALLLVFAHVRGWSSPRYTSKFTLKWDPDYCLSPSRGPRSGFFRCPVMCPFASHTKSVLPLNLVALARIQLAIA